MWQLFMRRDDYCTGHNDDIFCFDSVDYIIDYNYYCGFDYVFNDHFDDHYNNYFVLYFSYINWTTDNDNNSIDSFFRNFGPQYLSF